MGTASVRGSDPNSQNQGKLTSSLAALPPLAGTNLAIMLFAMNFVELKRYWDLKNPGSQGDGSFLGFTEEFKGKENGYPGECRRGGVLCMMWASAGDARGPFR